MSVVGRITQPIPLVHLQNDNITRQIKAIPFQISYLFNLNHKWNYNGQSCDVWWILVSYEVKLGLEKPKWNVDDVALWSWHCMVWCVLSLALGKGYTLQLYSCPSVAQWSRCGCVSICSILPFTPPHVRQRLPEFQG